jgi:3-methyladenine DNA glycosylase AlkD
MLSRKRQKKSKFTLQVEKELKALAPTKFKGKFKPEDFLRGPDHQRSALIFFNTSMPTIKNYLARLNLLNQNLSTTEQFFKMQNLWYESDVFDSKIIALYWLDEQDLDFLMQKQKEVLKWADDIDNWAHADTFCSTLARMFEQDQKKLLPTYLKWNKSKNPWHRRCSMVGTFYYSRSRKTQPSFELAASLVFPHFRAPEYYVQKAVGWTLREMYNVYPKKSVDFIRENNFQLSPVAWVAASEKLPKSIKNPLLKERKRFRKIKTNSQK